MQVPLLLCLSVPKPSKHPPKSTKSQFNIRFPVSVPQVAKSTFRPPIHQIGIDGFRGIRVTQPSGPGASYLTAPQATPCGLLAPLLGVLHAVRLEARADSAGRLIAREQACSARAFHFRARWGRHADSPSTRTTLITNYATIALWVETNSTLRHQCTLECACSLSGTRILKKLSADQCCPSLRLLHSRIADPCPAPPSRWRSQ